MTTLTFLPYSKDPTAAERNRDFLRAVGVDPHIVKLGDHVIDSDSVTLNSFRVYGYEDGLQVRRACQPSIEPCDCSWTGTEATHDLKCDTITVPLTADPADYGLLVSA